MIIRVALVSVVHRDETGHKDLHVVSGAFWQRVLSCKVSLEMLVNMVVFCECHQ